MSERDFMAKVQAEWTAQKTKREEDWPKALDKLYITFEASHGADTPSVW